MPSTDPVVDAIDTLTEALRRSISRQEEALRKAEIIRRGRIRGARYSDIVREELRPLVVELLSSTLRELQEHGSRLRRAEARTLRDEGLTQDQIAELFGVTRQRIAALLREEEHEFPAPAHAEPGR